VLQRPHFLPKVKPSSVAQTAHFVRIIVLYAPRPPWFWAASIS